MMTPSPKKPLGLILQEADLISVPQIKLALQDQAQFKHLRLGEILALRGWVKQQTADFFVEQWPQLLIDSNLKHQPIGYYLQAAGLLDEEQIDEILFDQKLLGQKFCSTAILKGLLKQSTMKFFLENLSRKPKKSSLIQFIEYSEDLLENTVEKAKILYVGEPHITIPETTMTIAAQLGFEWIEA